jgi:hypothetical protein
LKKTTIPYPDWSMKEDEKTITRMIIADVNIVKEKLDLTNEILTTELSIDYFPTRPISYAVVCTRSDIDRTPPSLAPFL